MKPSKIKQAGQLNAKLRNEIRTTPKELKNKAPITIIADAQDIEEELMKDTKEYIKLNMLLNKLDAVLERIPESDYDLKRYLIEGVLRDRDENTDPEAEGIINKGFEIFGDYNKIMTALSYKRIKETGKWRMQNLDIII